MSTPYFLEYQLAWLLDTSPVKIWEKSRRIGATYIQSYEDVYDILMGKYPAVWFSSADETAAREYIRYCGIWAKLFSLAAPSFAVLEMKKAPGLLQLHFANGKRITALTSNPKAFRSKGGKVVLDEFAHHNQEVELWKAAKPVTVWGYPLRILSTHNGQQSLFYHFIEDIRAGNLNWSLHTTTIHSAVEQGLMDAILGRKAQPEECTEWLDELRKGCYDDTVWHEEFCCLPVDESTAFLSFDLIRSCERSELQKESLLIPGKHFYAGIDIGRKHDLTVLFVLEKIDEAFYTRTIRILKNESFQHQFDMLFAFFKTVQIRKCCIDATGLGMGLAEALAQKLSSSLIEAVTFTLQTKEKLAYLLKQHFENQAVFIPVDEELRDDLHSVSRSGSSGHHTKFTAARTETGGHADRFWALALALYAAENEVILVTPASRRARPTSKTTNGFQP
jgi:phage FluMu gp28-like protein